MNANAIVSILGAITAVAMVTTIVSHKESARVVGALGNAYAGALRAAQGR